MNLISGIHLDYKDICKRIFDEIVNKLQCNHRIAEQKYKEIPVGINLEYGLFNLLHTLIKDDISRKQEYKKGTKNIPFKLRNILFDDSILTIEEIMNTCNKYTVEHDGTITYNINNENLFEVFKYSAGKLWADIYWLCYTLESANKDMNGKISMIKHEMDIIKAFDYYANESVKTDNVGNKYLDLLCNSYCELKKGVLRENEVDKVNIFFTESWIYGRYFYYHEYLKSEHSRLSNKYTVRQYAFIFYYLRMADIIKLNCPMEVARKEFCVEYDIKYKSFKPHHVEIQRNAKNKDSNCIIRQQGTKNNIKDLIVVCNYLKPYPIALEYAENDLSAAKENYGGGTWRELL